MPEWLILLLCFAAGEVFMLTVLFWLRRRD